MDTKKFIRVLIRIVAALMLVVAVVLILINRGVIEFVDSEDKVKKPNENFTATTAIEDGEVSVEKTDVDSTGASNSAGVMGIMAGALDGIEGATYVASDIELGADYKSQFSEFLESFEDKRGPISARGVYVTGQNAGNEDSLAAILEMVDQTDLNTVVIDVKDDLGNVTFRSNINSRFDIKTEVGYISDISGLVQELHDKGLYVVARIVTFKDPLLAKQKPEWSLHNLDGTVYLDSQDVAWVNPYCTDVWEYIYSISDSAAAAGFDEIQYDYIRFSTGSGMDDVDYGEKARYVARTDVICQFLSGAYMRLAPKGVYVSADVFGTVITSKSDGDLIGQDFIEMSQYCDYICPMIYPSHFASGTYGIDDPDGNPHDTVYAVMSDAMEQYAKALNEKSGIKLAKLRPWLQAFSASWLEKYVDYEGRHVRSQVRALNDLGINDWYAWNAACNYSSFKYGFTND